MLAVLVVLVLVSFTVGEDLSRCPTNLPRNEYVHTHGDHCYEFVVHHHVTWHKAVDACGSKGGNLVVVRDYDDQHFLMSTLSSYNFQGQGIWIGLSDETTEGTFRWVTGEPNGYTFWAAGQPDSTTRRRRIFLDGLFPNQIHLGPDEDCVLLKYTDSGKWHDYPCSHLLLIPENFPYVCEFAMSPVPTTTTTTTMTTPLPTITTPTVESVEIPSNNNIVIG